MSKEQSCRLGKVGGQAVLEGIMMRSGDNIALAVRREDGSVVVKRSTHTSLRKKHKICNIPLLRGCINMVETLIMSMGTLEDSANMLGIDEIEEETKFEKWLRRVCGDKLMNVIMAVAMVLGVALSIGLFVFLPNYVVFGVNALWKHFFDAALPSIVQNIISGVIRIGIFVGYICLVSLMKDIRRTFEYHGAEHKSIACYEAGEELCPENAKKYTRFHPRCGTSFIIIVLIISILATAFINWNTWPKIAIILTKFAMIPVIVGISFEFLMWAGKHPNPVTRFLSAPGLWMQRATTKEPDASQLEVAIIALKCAMPDEFPEMAELYPDWTKDSEEKKVPDEGDGSDVQ